MRVPSSLTFDPAEIGGSMTPMIDVVFLLLIYFLCTASFAISEQVLPTALPPAGSATYTVPPEIQELELMRISLRQPPEGLRLELNGNALASISELADRLRQLVSLADLPAVLDIGGEVALGNVVAAYDTCLIAGVRDIHFAAPDR
jgi:biopolymer transport protein ExbD